MSISQGTRISDSVIGKYNLEIIARERGKIVQRSETHNIVTNIGRQFMAQSIIAAADIPSETYSRAVIRYVGFGIGGTRQSDTILANAAPLTNAYNPLGGMGYPGTTPGTQTDTDPTISGLERPVRIVDGVDGTPGVGGAIWMRNVAWVNNASPATLALTFPTDSSVRFVALISAVELNGAASMPLSEVGLYTSNADPSYANGTPPATYPGGGGTLAAYDTFDTIHKTGAISMEIRWDFRF